jgi:hypothetical protein
MYISTHVLDKLMRYIFNAYTDKMCTHKTYTVTYTHEGYTVTKLPVHYYIYSTKMYTVQYSRIFSLYMMHLIFLTCARFKTSL